MRAACPYRGLSAFQEEDAQWFFGRDVHVQKVLDIRFDCDEDVILLKVEQQGGIACHTGRHNCFFKKLENGQWVVTTPVIKDPKEIYHK
jgi:phosphoribosyl-AMP cyclohydrolase